ncbi:MAG TPA: PH domain-containing protein [Solirubrobacteraceae bacterium]|jgi:uncharacterized membrane protein YdbT with pleckstrin-like domain|nr:PH domain-containing protein [Solirubrobacteraceae bacterium]
MSKMLQGDHVIYSGHPSWRSMLDVHLGGLLLAVVAGVIGDLVKDVGIGIAAFAVVFLLTLGIGYLRRMATLYTVTDRHLHIRQGILTRREQQTTIDRVQNVSTSQSLFERVLLIGTVDFDTAGTEQSEFQFVGVASPRQVVKAVDEAQHRAGVEPV